MTPKTEPNSYSVEIWTAVRKRQPYFCASVQRAKRVRQHFYAFRASLRTDPHADKDLLDQLNRTKFILVGSTIHFEYVQ